MLTKIRERTQDALLREERLCGEASFRTLAEAIACAIFISQGKRLQYVNHAAEIITGYAREELLSMKLTDPFRRAVVLTGLLYTPTHLANSKSRVLLTGCFHSTFPA